MRLTCGRASCLLLAAALNVGYWWCTDSPYLPARFRRASVRLTAACGCLLSLVRFCRDRLRLMFRRICASYRHVLGEPYCLALSVDISIRNAADSYGASNGMGADCCGMLQRRIVLRVP